MVAEIVVLFGLGLCMVVLGLVTWLFRTVARMLDLPFGTMEWLLHGLGFLVTLPFVLAILVLWKGLEPVTWWVGGGILLAALVSFLGGAITLVRDILVADRRTLARR
jgi:hypothetical protein